MRFSQSKEYYGEYVMFFRLMIEKHLGGIFLNDVMGDNKPIRVNNRIGISFK